MTIQQFIQIFRSSQFQVKIFHEKDFRILNNDKKAGCFPKVIEEHGISNITEHLMALSFKASHRIAINKLLFRILQGVRQNSEYCTSHWMSLHDT